MEDRGLAALTAAILLLLQFHLWFLPASTAVRDPLLAGTRYRAERTDELRRLGIELAAVRGLAIQPEITTSRDGSGPLNAGVN